MSRSREPAYATKTAASVDSCSGGWSVAVVSSGAGGSWRRSARTAASATAAALASTLERKTSRSSDRSSSASTCLRLRAPAVRQRTTAPLAAVRRRRRTAALRAGGRRRGRAARAPSLRPGRSSADRASRASAADPPTSARIRSVDARNALLRSRSRMSRQATSAIALRPLTLPPARGRARRASAARS